MPSSIINATLCGLYKYTGLMSVQEKFARRSDSPVMAIVLFHRVTDAIPLDGLTVNTMWFRQFCQLMRAQFNVVTLDQMYDMAEGKTPPKNRTIAITFDDCYHDNLQAAKILHDFQLPATFFVPAEYVGTSHAFPWDRELPSLSNLTWDEVRQMAALGHSIQSHTMTHSDLGVVGADEARWQLLESKKKIEHEVQQPVSFLAYPYGQRNNFKPEYYALARELQYRGVVSAFGGFISSGMQGVLPREAMPYFRNLNHLELHLSGCLNWYYSLRGLPRTANNYAHPG